MEGVRRAHPPRRAAARLNHSGERCKLATVTIENGALNWILRSGITGNSLKYRNSN